MKTYFQYPQHFDVYFDKKREKKNFLLGGSLMAVEIDNIFSNRLKNILKQNRFKFCKNRRNLKIL